MSDIKAVAVEVLAALDAKRDGLSLRDWIDMTELVYDGLNERYEKALDEYATAAEAADQTNAPES